MNQFPPTEQELKDENWQLKLLKEEVLKLLKAVGDMDRILKSSQDRLFDRTFPWDEVNKAIWKAADIRHEFFKDIPTWEFTNDTEYRDRLKCIIESTKYIEPDASSYSNEAFDKVDEWLKEKQG